MIKLGSKTCFISLSVLIMLAPAACEKKTNRLLCSTDADCGDGNRCEAISGLCVPDAGGPSKFGGKTAGIGGIRGAFDCAVDWDADYESIRSAYKQPQKQGLASIVVTSPRPKKNCGDSRNDEEVLDKPKLLEGLKSGCSVRLKKRNLRSADRRASKTTAFVIQVGFAQYSTDPNLPIAGFRLNFRPTQIEAAAALKDGETLSLKPSEIMNDTLVHDGEISGRYFELCDADDFSDMMMGGGGMGRQESGGGEDDGAELRLRFIASQGELVITEYQPAVFVEGGTSIAGRLRGYFDFELVETGHRDAKPFGARCTLPTDCADEDGCVDTEIVSAECFSAECNPLLDQLEVGLCGGLCQDDQDCGYHPQTNATAYCLHIPGRKDGNCVQLCSSAHPDVCEGDSTCRPGSDFAREFDGEGGPARCVDRCIGSPSYTVPVDCPQPMMPPPMDGGMMMMMGDGGPPPPMDGGMMMMGDGGPPPPSDGGPPPPSDASLPHDAGVSMPHDAGVNMPSDTGVNMPADTGTTMSGSALGQFCDQTTSCPMGWGCARQVMAPMGTIVGYCSKPCNTEVDCNPGYTGPGIVFCGQAVRFLGQTMPSPRTCGIQCGESFVGAAMAGMCPHQMKCGDVINNANPSMMPPSSDGAEDYCTEQ